MEKNFSDGVGKGMNRTQKEIYNCFECIYLQSKKCKKCNDKKSQFVPEL